MYFYKAYGLNIGSVISLPELVSSNETVADVTIDYGKVNISHVQPYRGSEFMSLHVNNKVVTFFWGEVGAIEVRGAGEIILDPLPDIEEQLIHLPLLGMVFAVILHQRGLLPLHGSAVEINGGAAILLGGKGWGKSTLAATLYTRGHQLITDDLVAVDFDTTGQPIVIPAFPQLKLLPEAVAFTFGDDPDTLPEIARGYVKRAKRGIDRFSQEPLPIKGIYQLDMGSELALNPLSIHDAMLGLIGNSFIARCTEPLLEGNNKVQHFQQCISLIRQIPIYRLERPQSLELVPKIAQLVESNHPAITPSLLSCK